MTSMDLNIGKTNEKTYSNIVDIHFLFADQLLARFRYSGLLSILLAACKRKTTEGITRIEAAKTALLSLPADLENHDVGLMLFGHRKSPKETGACSDIELRLPIGPFSESQYKLTVAALQPRGATPIAGALMMAGDELMDRGQRHPKIRHPGH